MVVGGGCVLLPRLFNKNTIISSQDNESPCLLHAPLGNS